MLTNIDDVKKMIVQKFNNRTNDSVRGKIDFSKNKDVLDGIARTYMYYANNFPEKIDTSKIAFAYRFGRVLNKPAPDNMADLYLDRLLLNMLEIGETTDAKGLVQDGGIYFDKSSMNNQINYWKAKNNIFFDKNALNILNGNGTIVAKNLNDKVIIHELSHMSAIAQVQGESGFYQSSNKQTYASRLEEVCAETTALNVTKQKIPACIEIQNGNLKMRLGGYNPESSNYAISSFIELAPFAFGKKELEMGRLMDPESYMKELNSKHSAFARDGGTFAFTLQQDLKAITDIKDYHRLFKLQADFIKIGMKRITNPNYLKTCDELQFKQDVGFMLRTEKLLCRMYENSNLKSTENVVMYDKAMKSIEDIFEYLKANRNMFDKYSSFEDFKSEGILVIENSQRKALGLNPLKNQNVQTQPQGTKQPQQSTNTQPSQQPQQAGATSSGAKNLEDQIRYLQSLSLEPKDNDDYEFELKGTTGKTIEDLSCAFAIVNGIKVNPNELTYREIEKTLFEIVNLPDYNKAVNLSSDYIRLLRDIVGYRPSFGTVARIMQEQEKIESSNLDNKVARSDLLNNLGFYDTIATSERISKYKKIKNNDMSPVTNQEKIKVLLKMQDNYNQFGLQPNSDTPKNYNKLIDTSKISQSDNIQLEQKSAQDIQSEESSHYRDYGFKACPYSITNENGEKQDIWTLGATEVINKLVFAINSGDNNEITKMRIICENMQKHFNPSYNDMAKLTMIINDYWKLGNNPDVDRAIESLKDMAKDKYNEGLQIAKFNAQSAGRPQATYSELVDVFKELDEQERKKQLQAQTQSGQGGQGII